MKRPLLKLSFLFVLAATISACQPKKDTVRGQTNPLYNPINGVTGLGNINATCVQGQSQQTLGAIIDNIQPATFQSRVVALLTATMMPEEVGTVGASLSDSTGVRFKGNIYLDANGNVVSSSSSVTVTVYDSIWYNDYIINPSVEGIALNFSPSTGGSITGQFSNTTGVGYFLVKDSYGEIRFDGTITSQTFSGNVTFRNYANVTGQANTSGSLGQFQISTCGFVRK